MLIYFWHISCWITALPSARCDFDIGSAARHKIVQPSVSVRMSLLIRVDFDFVKSNTRCVSRLNLVRSATPIQILSLARNAQTHIHSILSYSFIY